MKHPDWVLTRLLGFLNYSFSADRLLSAPELKDDPNSGAEGGYVIGEKVAQNIITHRRSLPTRRYTSTEDILSVPGLGQDKLNDLLHSFSTSADQAYLEALRSGPIGENWDLFTPSVTFRDDKSYNAATAGLDVLGRKVAQLYAQTYNLKERDIIPKFRAAYVATHAEPHPASFPFAHWWYYFDQDNWFSFEQMRLLCEKYLGHHWGNDLQLCLFHFYNDSPLNSIWHRDVVPVVLNPAERKMTLWGAQLND
ncbi:MAG: hypothetical protein AAGA62_05560 [Bacteroidota bacterium]